MKLFMYDSSARLSTAFPQSGWRTSGEAVCEIDAKHCGHNSAYFGIIMIIAGIATIIFIAGIVPLIFGIIDLVIWNRTKRIRDEVEKLQLTQAKHDTLVWMVIGFILGGILIGVFMLIAYVKFDDLIKAYQTQATTGQQI